MSTSLSGPNNNLDPANPITQWHGWERDTRMILVSLPGQQRHYVRTRKCQHLNEIWFCVLRVPSSIYLRFIVICL